MRILTLAGLTMVTVFAATGADAQRIGTSYRPPVMQRPGDGAPVMPPPPPPMVNTQTPPMRGYPNRPYPGPRRDGGSRWGGSTGGRWQGGTYAPGGWNAYRRPTRGYRLPSYWIAPSFYIDDYAGYGLSAPQQGYGWHRYYDDAVLTDARGRVYDSVSGLDWDGGYGGGYASSDYGHADGSAGYGAGYPAGGDYPPPSDYGRSYAPPPVSRGGVTTYTTGGGYGGTTTVVTVQGAPSVTTTTTEYIEETRTRTRYVAPRRVYRHIYHAPKPHYCGCRRRVAHAERPILGS